MRITPAASAFVLATSAACAQQCWLPGQEILPPAPAAEGFGGAVALASTPAGATLLVGAGRATGTGAAPGSAWVFLPHAGGWLRQAQLGVPTPASGDQIGAGVALGRNATLALVGAPGRDALPAGTITDAGAAYAFAPSAGSWTLENTFAAPDAAAGDAFGSAVAYARSGALETVVVGAPKRGALDIGAAYVFTRDVGGAWTHQATLTSNLNPSPSQALLGSSVAIDGDTIAVGAPGHRGPAPGLATNAGAVYVFTRAPGGTAWT